MAPPLPPQALAEAMRSGPPQNPMAGALPSPQPSGPPPGAVPPQSPGGAPMPGMPPEQAQQMLASMGITPDKLPMVLMAVASLMGSMGASTATLPPPPPPIG